MDETLNSFTLRGRQYWLDENAMEVINYAVSYDTSLEIASKALNINLDLIDQDVPEFALYEEYVRNKDSYNPNQEIKYMKSKLWNIIDGQNRTSDIMKAIQILIELTLAEGSDSTTGIKSLKDASLTELQNMLKDIDNG